jgi:hypothetical protein
MLLPNFDVAAVDVLPCSLNSGFVVCAVEAMSRMENAIETDDVSAVVRHPCPPIILAGSVLALITSGAKSRAAMRS